MANTHSTLTSLFTDIADSIRGKTGETGSIVADNFATAIASIPTGVEMVEGDFTMSSASDKVTIGSAVGKQNIIILCTTNPTESQNRIVVAYSYNGLTKIAAKGGQYENTQWDATTGLFKTPFYYFASTKYLFIAW